MVASCHEGSDQAKLWMSFLVSRSRSKSATVAALRTVLHVSASCRGLSLAAVSLYCFSEVLITPERAQSALLIFSRNL